MRISLSFFPPIEIIGHRPGAPLDRADGAAGTLPNNQNGVDITAEMPQPSGTKRCHPSSLRSALHLLPIKVRRLPRPAWADVTVSSPGAVNRAAHLCALDDWVQQAPAQERDSYRNVAAQFRACWLDPSHTELSVYNFAGASDLPPVPPNVTELTLWGCHQLVNFDASGCTELRHVKISWCFGLRHVALAQCRQLATLQRAGCPNLATLDISGCSQLSLLEWPASHQLHTVDAADCAQLAHLDLTACANLTSLNLSGCAALQTLALSRCTSLSVLPQLGTLAQLQTLDLSDTALTSLPDDIVQLSSTCRIELDASRLSDAVRNRLTHVMNAPGYVGPRIVYSMDGSYGATPILPIDQAVATWRAEAQTPLQQVPSNLDWHSLPAQDNVAAFAIFLARVRETSDYFNAAPALKSATQHRIGTLLTQLENDPVLREDCFNLALDAVNTCGDRVALRLMDMEQSGLIAEARSGIDAGRFDTDPRALIDLCKGQYRLAIIAAAAENKVASLHFTDPIEVHLGYLVKLAQPCKLPVRITTMLYPACAGVDDDDLAVAFRDVMNQGTSPAEQAANDAAYQNYLAASGLMCQLLRRRQPVEMGALDSDNAALVQQAQQAIHARLEGLPSTATNLDQQGRQLMDEYHRVAVDIPARATLPLLRDFLRAHDIESGLCDSVHEGDAQRNTGGLQPDATRR